MKLALAFAVVMLTALGWARECPNPDPDTAAKCTECHGIPMTSAGAYTGCNYGEVESSPNCTKTTDKDGATVLQCDNPKWEHDESTDSLTGPRKQIPQTEPEPHEAPIGRNQI